MSEILSTEAWPDCEAPILRRLMELCLGNGVTVSTAESCTGGLLSGALTHLPGSSGFFKGGVIAYDNGIKTGLLGVGTRLLEDFGAVSAEVAVAMADGVRTRTGSDFGVALTGIAGPGGASAGKPVGTVFCGLSSGLGTRAVRLALNGSRTEIRLSSVHQALTLLGEMITRETGG